VGEPPRIAAPLRSTRQAALFCALLAALLGLPAVLSALGLYSRRDAYQEMPQGAGPYAFIEVQVLDERSDVDVLLIGPSVLWMGVDAPLLAAELERREGRPVNVLTFGYKYPGLDVAYAMLRDALAHRRVRTLVMTLLHRSEDDHDPHPWSYHFLPWGEDPAMTRGLGARDQLALYAESVLGAPRHLLSFVRANPDKADHPLERTRGANLQETGFRGAPYRPLRLDPPAVPVETLVYSPASADRFAFDQQPWTPYQAHFLDLIVDLVRTHGIRLIALHVPQWTERASRVVEERFDWSAALGVGASIVGVPPAVLFAGLSEDEIERLYADTRHFNASGAALFTRAVAPALLELHAHAP
jgi:hypothetical protein